MTGMLDKSFIWFACLMHFAFAILGGAGAISSWTLHPFNPLAILVVPLMIWSFLESLSYYDENFKVVKNTWDWRLPFLFTTLAVFDHNIWLWYLLMSIISCGSLGLLINDVYPVAREPSKQ